MQKLKDHVTKLYEKAFCVEELAAAIVNDVNRVGGELAFEDRPGVE